MIIGIFASICIAIASVSCQATTDHAYHTSTTHTAKGDLYIRDEETNRTPETRADRRARK